MIIISTKQVPKNEQHSHAHLLLSRCLKEYGVDYAANETPVVLGEHGKPSLAEYPELYYNISHANGVAAAIVSEHECGIDCECIRPYDQRVMKRAFSDRERKCIENAPENDRDLLFFSMWTLKEAYIKALGKGIAFPMNKAEFYFDGDTILTDLTKCTFTQYILNHTAIVSVCRLCENYEPQKTLFLQTSEDIIVL